MLQTSLFQCKSMVRRLFRAQWRRTVDSEVVIPPFGHYVKCALHANMLRMTQHLKKIALAIMTSSLSVSTLTSAEATSPDMVKAGPVGG